MQEVAVLPNAAYLVLMAVVGAAPALAEIFDGVDVDEIVYVIAALVPVS